MYSEDIIDELRDRVRDTFTALDVQTRLEVERSLRLQMGIPDRMADPWRVFAARLLRTVSAIEEEWSIHQGRRDDVR